MGVGYGRMVGNLASRLSPRPDIFHWGEGRESLGTRLDGRFV